MDLRADGSSPTRANRLVKWLIMYEKKKDLIAITSFEKRLLIMQVLLCPVLDSVIIVNLPLLALGTEQKEKILTIRGVFLNGDNVNHAGYAGYTLIS